MTKPKQYKITNEQLEEIIEITTNCDLTTEDAIRYAKATLKEFNKDNENDNKS